MDQVGPTTRLPEFHSRDSLKLSRARQGRGRGQSLTDSGNLEVGVGFEPCPVQKVVEMRVCVCYVCMTSRCSRGGAESHLADVLMGSLGQAGSAAPAPE